MPQCPRVSFHVLRCRMLALRAETATRPAAVPALQMYFIGRKAISVRLLCMQTIPCLVPDLRRHNAASHLDSCNSMKQGVLCFPCDTFSKGLVLHLRCWLLHHAFSSLPLNEHAYDS